MAADGARPGPGVRAGSAFSWQAARGTLGLYATELQLLVALAALFAVFAAVRPSSFPTWSNADNMARVGAILLVIAIGQAFALIVGGFDISVAANAGFVSVVIALVANEHGGLAVGVPVGLLVGLLVGLVNGFFIAGLGVNAFVATLAMLTFLIGLGNELAGGASVATLSGANRFLG